MSNLSPEVRTKLARVLGLLGSDHAGERDAAGVAASRIVKAAGMTWEDVLQPSAAAERLYPPQTFGVPPSRNNVAWTDLQFCCRNVKQLTKWESSFVHSLVVLPRWSRGQKTKLAEIAAGLRSKNQA